MGVDKRKRSGEGAKKATSKRQKTASGAPKKVVNVNQLKWKKVEIPETFDDAEGFFGLEEIEGVDIVREGNTVKFVATADVTKDEKSEASDDGEDFEGFDDPPEAAQDTEKSAETQKKSPKEQKKSPKDAKKEAKDQTKDKKRDIQEKKSNSKDEKKDEKKEAKPQKKAQEIEADPELEANLFTKLDELEDLPEADVDEVDLTQWSPLNLSPQMMSAIGSLKFFKPTAIQARTIPEIIKGHDVIGKASTGSGKTLAFGIPIVESWLSKNADSNKDDKKKSPIALILSPTRELAHQISDHLKKLCEGLKNGPYICSVTGGLAIQKQQRQLEKADIVIGTPGRIWEVMSTGTSTLEAFKGINFLVVDEADRLLKDGQFKEAEEILKALDRTVTTENYDDEDEDENTDSEDQSTPNSKRQTLVFSATFNKALQQKLAGKARYNLMGEAESLEHLLKKLNFRETQPKFIDANPVSQMAENLKEGLIHCGDLEKDLYLYAVLLLQPTHRALVFTNSINTVRRLTPFLQSLNLPAVALHSDMEQKARLRSLEKFRAPVAKGAASPVLVATDVAARGLDIPNVDLVIHYHVPRSADDYVHRSGRTARADNSGVSVLLCGPKEDIPTQRLIAKVHASAAAANPTKSKKSFMGVQTVDIDRRLVSHLRPRVSLSKKITETTIAKERGSKEEDWLKNAAEELGVEYDSEELEKAGTWKGRGSGRKQKEKQAKEVTKAEMKQWRWELKELLNKRVNTGVSEKYLIGVDVDALLKGEKGEFLGKVDGLGL